MDYSLSMLDVAKSRLSKEIQDGVVSLQYGSVAKLPMEDATFDKIFHCNVYYFWDDCLGCCRELLRVLKPGGLIITTLEIAGLTAAVSLELLDKDRADANNYVAALKKAGFIGVTIDEQYVAGKLFKCISARARSN